MKNLILYLSFTILIASCNTTKRYYFYSKMDGLQNVEKNERGSFLVHKDSIDLFYSFFGENITMEVTVDNKTDYPLYINWDKSWIRVNDQKPRPYNTLISYVEFEPVTEQLPNVRNTYNLLSSAHFDLKQISRKNLEKQKLYFSDKKIYTRTIEFEKDSSPLVLTSCIYINCNDKETPIENSFYLSSLTNGNKKAYKTFLCEMEKRDDGFCINYHVDKKEAKIANGFFSGLLFLTQFMLNNKLDEMLDD